jgi:putative peptide zinc metalloprotease protein
MSVDTGPPAGGLAGPTPERTDAGAAVPQRADGVELLGSMQGSGYRNPPALVRRRDGQVLQLTPLLYQVLEAIDGERTVAQVATHATERVGRSLDAEGVRALVDRLRELGVLRLADGSEPPVRKASPLLALRFRYVISDPERTRRITAPFARLFHPLLAIAVLVAFGWICKWVLFDRGLGYAAHQAFARPGLLLAIFAITLLSAGFHEFGHAAAARYGGATPGVMGAGLYLVWPAFYTDVTDSYRLGRAGRIRTDLGGLYFNAVLSVAMFGLWWLTGWDALLLVIATQLIQMIRQLPPLLRFDGYHLLADITGVPDLFHQIGPTLRGLWPGQWRRSESHALRLWARVVVLVWVLLVVPLMAMTVFVSVISLPRIIATGAASLDQHWRHMVEQFGAGKVLAGVAGLLAVVAVALPMFGIAYMVVRLARQVVRGTLRATDGRPARRTLAAGLAAALVVGLAFVWWPHGNYRQIQAYERGALQDAFPAALHTGLRSGSGTALWPADAGAVPTAQHPALAMVLIPRSGSGPTWVFPFDRPLPPGSGDNQTLAVNTRNGTAVYDVAFALVWANSDNVLNKNEAYAFASCSHCKAEAISFQVILIIGHANVIVPQNISAAVNYNCIVCVTQALAVQLVLTLPSQPTGQEIRDINALWRQIQAWSRNIRNLPFAVIHARLAQYERQIIAIITKDSGGVAPGVVTPSTPASPTSPPVGSSPDQGSVAPGQPGASTSAAGGAAPGSAAPAPSQSPAPSSPAPTSSAPPS